jgi:hypothetical protein
MNNATGHLACLPHPALGTTEENCNTIQLRALFGQLESLRESLQTLRAGGYGLL